MVFGDCNSEIRLLSADWFTMSRWTSAFVISPLRSRFSSSLFESESPALFEYKRLRTVLGERGRAESIGKLRRNGSLLYDRRGSDHMVRR